MSLKLLIYTPKQDPEVNDASSSHFFIFHFLSVADLSATDYGIAAECSLCVCLSVCVNHENLVKFHPDFFEISQVDFVWPN